MLGSGVFEMLQIGLAERLGLYNKKAPRKVLFDNWCGVLCSYRTNIGQDFKSLSRKSEDLSQNSFV